MQIDLDALFASAPSPYVLLDAQLSIVWANDAYLAITEREHDALIGRKLTEEFPAPAGSVSDQLLQGSFRKVLATGRADHLPLIPYPIEIANGQFEDRYWSMTQSPIMDSQGRLEFILLNVLDVTDIYLSEISANPDELPQRAALTQRAEKVAADNLALGAMTDFFQSAFDQAPSFMAIFDGPEHIFQITNQSYTNMIGGKNVIGLTVRKALPEIAGQGFYELLDQVFISGEPVSIKGKAATLRTGAGSSLEQHTVDFFCYPLKDESGATTGIFLQGHDVTGQQIAESALTATREKFRTMAQNMPNHVWTAEKDGALNWLNDRTYEFTGYGEGDLYGLDWARVVHPDDLETVTMQWGDAIQKEVEYEAEFRIRKGDGSFRWHLVRATPLRTDQGALAGWVGVNIDIEDRKNSEDEIAKLNETLETRVAARNLELEELHATLRQSQKMEAIGNLAGGIAHDFNNLLQVITSNLELVAKEIPQEPAVKARLEQAMKSVMRGATLASQLLSFARKQPLAPVIIDLNRLLGENTEILHSAVGEGVELETRFEEGLWNTSADPNNLENALINMSINARDAMGGQGKLTIDVGNAHLDTAYIEAHPDAQKGEYVVLSVTDTGSGIAPDTLEHIFEPFFTTKADGHGTGLGLSMVYGFAKQSGGHITIDSEVGTGTTIRIYLPRSTDVEQVEQLVEPVEPSRGTETVLLVEDDDAVRTTAFEMLVGLGYSVLQASDPEHALGLLEGGQHIDLLFTDVVMPGKINGQALAEKIYLTNPDVPVLFTSGYVQDAIVHDGRLDDGVQLLGKPYTQTELAQKIRAVLNVGKAPPPSTNTVHIAKQDNFNSTPSFNGLTILLCEDDVFIREDIAWGLRDAGCTVLEAGTAGEAAELLRSQSVGLLVTDVGLPDKTGEELAQDARAVNPDLPIIFATGGVEVPAAEILGNCKVVSKPFRNSELLEAIGRMIFKS